MKVIITESQYNRAIDYYISHLLEPHGVTTFDGYKDSIFWVQDKKIIAEIQESEIFWLDYDIWQDISRVLNLNKEEIEFVLKMWLQQHYDLGGLTPRYGSYKSIKLS